MAHLQGGSFRDAFKISLITAIAATAYKSYVGWTASPEPGENQEPGKNKYEFTEDGKMPDDWENKNVVGHNEKLNGNNDTWKQSGVGSRAANVIPGINATARVHDNIFNGKGLPQTTWNNAWTMYPSAVLAYTALYDQVPAADRNRCPGCYK